MKKTVGLISAVCFLMLTVCGVYAATTPESLITLSYLTQYFVPNAVERGTQTGNELLNKEFQQAKDEAEQLQGAFIQQVTGDEGLYSADLRPRDYREEDRLILTTGSGMILYNGTVKVEHNGAVIDVNTGEEIASGGALSANHRCLIAEETTAVVTILSGGAQLGIQGGYAAEESGKIATGFYDVAQTDWYYAPVNYAYANGLFSGMDEHHFSPTAPMNRAMLMTVLYKMAGAPEDELKAATIAFDDVPENAWYASFVKWGAQQGITAGTGPATFSPELQVTREQVVALLYSFATKYLGKQLDGRADLSGYADLDQASSWALDALSWAVDAGILSSSSADQLTLSAGRNANRAEVAAMLRAFNEKIL